MKLNIRETEYYDPRRDMVGLAFRENDLNLSFERVVTKELWYSGADRDMIRDYARKEAEDCMRQLIKNALSTTKFGTHTTTNPNTTMGDTPLGINYAQQAACGTKNSTPDRFVIRNINGGGTLDATYVAPFGHVYGGWTADLKRASVFHSIAAATLAIQELAVGRGQPIYGRTEVVRLVESTVPQYTTVALS